jgi:hypothetical protein
MTTLNVSTRFVRRLVVAAAAMAMSTATFGPAKADPASCRTKIVKQMYRFKKVYLKSHEKCLEKENIGKISGPCPDPVAQLKVQKVNSKVVEAISARCTMADIAALGFPADCAFEAATTGIEATCAALPVTTPAEFAECLKCWKAAELSEYIALLFASHALEECDGALDETSSRCSDLDCTTPLPEQRNLGDTGENDCQKGIGKKGVKYLLKREKILEKCLLVPGATQAGCLADLVVQAKLAKAEHAKQVGIQKKCGNRAPAASTPFCCKTGSPQVCSAATSRDDCTTNIGGTVVEGKTCDAGSCTNVGGPNQKVTWWEYCPESDTCPGTALATRDDLIACVDSSADRIVDELLCLQFPGVWTCPVDVP